MKLEYLQEDAKKFFIKAQELSLAKPEQSKKTLITGHRLMLLFYIVNQSQEIDGQIDALLTLSIEYFEKLPDEAYVHIQNEYALLSLAYSKMNLASRIISFPAAYDGYLPFEILLNLRLRKLLGVTQNSFAIKRKVSALEQSLLDCFDALIASQPINWEAASSFWKSTRSRRYKNTILEHSDLFSLALRNAECNLITRLEP